MRTWMSAPVGAAAVLCAIAPAAHAELVYGVTQQQRLISFDTASPGVILSGSAITGLASNEQIAGIDLRPSDGLMYGLGSQSNLYRINMATGAATLVSALSLPLSGGNFGFDFNPTGPVALRIVSNTANNYRVTNPGTGGSVVQDTSLAYVSGDAAFGMGPNITHVAYTNSFFGSTSTALYGIDASRDTLVRILAPNAGTVSTIGPLGMGNNANINVIGGFDISGVTGNAFAATQNISLSQSTLWGINLTTGAGVDLGAIGGGETLVAFTLVPAPGFAALAGAGALVLGARRRRG